MSDGSYDRRPKPPPATTTSHREDTTRPRVWRLTTGHKIDLGDSEVGRPKNVRTAVYALGREQGPRVTARVNGDPQIRYVSGPTFLPGTMRPAERANEFELQFAPSRSGIAPSTLEIHVEDAPQETHEIPIVAAANVPGQPTVREEQDERRRAAEDAQRADEEARQHRAADAKLLEERSHNREYHTGAHNALKEQQSRASVALEALLGFQRNGIDSAEKEIGDFRRARPAAEDPSLLAVLAELAIAMATAGVAGAVARRLTPGISKALASSTASTPVRNMWWKGGVSVVAAPAAPARDIPASDALVAFCTDSVKEGVKVGSRAAIAQARKAGSDEPTAVVSANPAVAFFKHQRDQIVENYADRALVVSTRTLRLLEPMVVGKRGDDTWPRHANAAIAAMQAIADGLWGEVKQAQAMQLDITVRKWISYVAQTSAGKVDARDSSRARGKQPTEQPSLTDARALASPAHAGQHFDGIIELTAHGVLTDATAPLTISSARLNGVKRAVVERTRSRPLVDLDIPVRLMLAVFPSDATLIVARNEAGDVQFSDATGADGSARGSWLARRAGATGNAHAEDQRAGARHLLQHDILSRSLDQLLVHLPDDFFELEPGTASRVANDSDE